MAEATSWEVPADMEGVIIAVEPCIDHGAHTLLYVYVAGKSIAEAELTDEQARTIAGDLTHAASMRADVVKEWRAGLN